MKYRVKATHVQNWVRENYDREGVITGEPTFFLTDGNGDKWFDAESEEDAERIEEMERTTAASLEAMRQADALGEKAKARRDYLRRCIAELTNELANLERDEEIIYGEWKNLVQYDEAHHTAIKALDEITYIAQRMLVKCDFIYGQHGATERVTTITVDYSDDDDDETEE